jgi:hypothetical protein
MREDYLLAILLVCKCNVSTNIVLNNRNIYFKIFRPFKHFYWVTVVYHTFFDANYSHCIAIFIIG